MAGSNADVSILLAQSRCDRTATCPDVEVLFREPELRAI
jgi:hypothetical protein